jgi:uncharacterized membrane protein (UPF0127 family)
MIMRKLRHLMRFSARAALAASLLVASGAALSQSTQPEPLSAFPQSMLAVKTAAGKVVNFKIWLADTRQREEQGMMFVREMDIHTGMLFMFPENKPVTMWMKNTYVSLDLLFLDAHGKIDYIQANATPRSLDIIGPKTPEYAVLELKGGACEQFGIKLGDRVIHSNFKNAR